MKKKAIFGVGGLARELYYQLLDKNIVFFVDDDFICDSKKIDNKPIYPISDFNSLNYELIIAVSDPLVRNKIVSKLPADTSFWSFIHSSVELNNTIKLGKGSILMKNAILTTSIEIGDFAIIHSFVVVAHDCVIGDYFCATYGAKVSGNVKIGMNFFMGSNSSIRENITICDNVKLGIGSVVVKNINYPGKYIGVPCKKL